MYAFLCKYFDNMLIPCNIFVELEHFVLFNNLITTTSLHLLQDKHKINGSRGSSCQHVVMLQVLHVILKFKSFDSDCPMDDWSTNLRIIPIPIFPLQKTINQLVKDTAGRLGLVVDVQLITAQVLSHACSALAHLHSQTAVQLLFGRAYVVSWTGVRRSSGGSDNSTSRRSN